MNIAIFLVSCVVFAILETILCLKTKKPFIKYIPTGAAIIGLLFCIVVLLGVFGAATPSAAAENRYFAIFISIPLSGALAGCILGFLLSKSTVKNTGLNK